MGFPDLPRLSTLLSASAPPLAALDPNMSQYFSIFCPAAGLSLQGHYFRHLSSTLCQIPKDELRIEGPIGCGFSWQSNPSSSDGILDLGCAIVVLNSKISQDGW